MANRDYKPQADSVPGRVIAFFTANPDEELVSSDLSIKFSRHHSAFHSLLAPAVEAGYLKREPNEEDEVAYSLGGVAAPSVRGGKVQATVLFAEPKAAYVRRDPFVCDPTLVAIRTGVPLPVGRTTRGTDWVVLLERMKKGEYAELPIQCYSSLSGACTLQKRKGAGEYSCRKINKDFIGLWRVK